MYESCIYNIGAASMAQALREVMLMRRVSARAAVTCIAKRGLPWIDGNLLLPESAARWVYGR